jgi:transposase
MINLSKINAIYFACGVTDLRKSVDGLAQIIQEDFKLDPFSTCLFAFCNRTHDKIKILHWDYNGFWLYYKRLERGRFRWPNTQKEVIKIDMREFKSFLDGYEVRIGKVFKEVKQRRVI